MICPFDTERALSTTQLSYQPQEAVLFSCSLRANPAGTLLTSTLEPAARPNSYSGAGKVDS